MIVILGCNGMLGAYAHKYFSRCYKGVKGVSRKQFDFYTNAASIKLYLDTLGVKEDDVVINCIGVIKPQVEKIGYAQTIFINSVLPHILADYCEKIGAYLVHPTTDCVFSGLIGSYTASSPHDELDIYGKSKSLGEPNNATCVRVSIIGEEKTNSRSLIEWAKGQKNKTVNGYFDHKWNGVTCLEWCRLVDSIVIKKSYWKGVKNWASAETVTKAKLLELISDAYELNLTINEIESPKFCDRTLVADLLPPAGYLKRQLKELKEFKL